MFRAPHRPRWIGLVVAGFAVSPFFFGAEAQTPLAIHVPADHASIQGAVTAAPDHAVIEIAAGTYRESIVVDRPLTLRGSARGGVELLGTAEEATIEVVDTHGVRIEGLTIVGGKYGIFVTRSQGVAIENNVVSESRLVGIKVRLASADIVGNVVTGAAPPYGYGIHVTNTTQWPPSRIIGNTVTGSAKSGIITNMAPGVRIENNLVTANHQHGIAVTEMSHALVIANRVDRNEGNGIFVEDMSSAIVCSNVVSNTVQAGPPRVLAGNGILVNFHSRAELVDNTVFGNANFGIRVLLGSLALAVANDLHDNRIDMSGGVSAYEVSGDPVAYFSTCGVPRGAGSRPAR